MVEAFLLLGGLWCLQAFSPGQPGRACDMLSTACVESHGWRQCQGLACGREWASALTLGRGLGLCSGLPRVMEKLGPTAGCRPSCSHVPPVLPLRFLVPSS